MTDLAGLSTHMNDVANQLRDAAHAEQHESHKQYFSTEAKRWAEMARKANLLAQGIRPNKKAG
jgi:hypothetical protein